MLPSVTANNSVTLSWAQPDGSLPIENYVVSLQRGSNQPFCSDEIDSRQMNTNDQSFFFPNLYGSSSYTATVIARAFDISMMRSRQFMTPASRKFTMIKVIDWKFKHAAHTWVICTSPPEGLYTSTGVNALPIISPPLWMTTGYIRAYPGQIYFAIYTVLFAVFTKMRIRLYFV